MLSQVTFNIAPLQADEEDADPSAPPICDALRGVCSGRDTFTGSRQLKRSVRFLCTRYPYIDYGWPKDGSSAPRIVVRETALIILRTALIGDGEGGYRCAARLRRDPPHPPLPIFTPPSLSLFRGPPSFLSPVCDVPEGVCSGRDFAFIKRGQTSESEFETPQDVLRHPRILPSSIVARLPALVGESMAYDSEWAT